MGVTAQSRFGQGSRYVAVPSQRLVEELEDIGERMAHRGACSGWTSQGCERVWQLDLRQQQPSPSVLVYTSLSLDGQQVRGCGEDTVRVVVGIRMSEAHWRPIRDSRRLYRTAPRGPQSHRVEAFCRRLREALREAVRVAMNVPRCHECGGPMKVREGRRGHFLGCCSYPECQATRDLPKIDGDNP